MPQRDLPRVIRRAMERRLRRAEKALERGDLQAAKKLGLRVKHRIRLVRDGEVVLDLGGGGDE